MQIRITQTLISDRQGRYRAPELRVGDYLVQVSNAGFDTVVYKGKALDVSVQSAVDFSLAVGQQTETVVCGRFRRWKRLHVPAADARIKEIEIKERGYA
jgi:hypothetical protein